MKTQSKRSAIRIWVENRRGITCDRSQHLLEYYGKTIDPRTGKSTNKHESRCSRCRQIFITSVPIGSGHPQGA